MNDSARPCDLAAHLVVERAEGFRLDIGLRLGAGTTTALLGPNGAGKSTTVDALAGHLALDAGLLRLGERVLDDPSAGVFVPPERRRVGVVFQDGLLFEHLDAADNVGFGPAVAGAGRRRARRVGLDWLERLGLADLAQRRPAQLSGGQAQQVALARALAAAPDLLILDEPLSALDVATRPRIRRFLADHLADHPGPRLLITHDPTDAFLLADRVVVLEAGRIAQEGTPDEVRRHPTTPYVAALSGRNLLTGHSDGGVVRLDGTEHELRCADTHTAGPVVVTIHPNALALHRRRPEGSPRNVWRSTVVSVEPLGEIVRVSLGGPLPLSADVTPTARETLDITAGTELWVSVKATEIELGPA